MMVAAAKAQDAEPRLYSNTPVGLNFLLAGYVYAQGKMAFDPALRIADADFKSKCRGIGICAVRFSVNVFGSPALTAKQFPDYKQDFIVGVSLQVSAPLGQYDDTELLNLGNHRWSFRPELGFSKAWASWTLEVAPSVTLFTVNSNFFYGQRFEQAPLYLVRTSLMHNFNSGAWISLDGIYFRGARTTVDGAKGDNEQENVRAGFIFALPIDRQNSIKLNAGTGIYTRTGSRFSNMGSRGSIDGVKVLSALTRKLSESFDLNG